MALAWNAGWVNSPRGFKSRILRHWSANADTYELTWIQVGRL